MEIAFCRIDDRLIHGQVATVWTKVTGCNRIMCCNDDVAQDTLRKKLLLQVIQFSINVIGIIITFLIKRGSYIILQRLEERFFVA